MFGGFCFGRFLSGDGSARYGAIYVMMSQMCQQRGNDGRVGPQFEPLFYGTVGKNPPSTKDLRYQFPRSGVA
eukprot:4373690-Amphidinium_carterae.1